MDPRYTTAYSKNYHGLYFHDRIAHNQPATFYLPASVKEVWCRPGYQPKRPDKGYALTINDYYYHQLQYGDSWKKVVY